MAIGHCILGGVVLGVALAALATVAHAEYPERAVKMVIPYGAGGATDISARTIAESHGNAVGNVGVMLVMGWVGYLMLRL